MKFLKNLFKRKVQRKQIYSFQGHTFEVLNPATMPKVRQSSFFMGEYERDWGMTKSDLLAYDDIIVREAGFPKSWGTKDDLIADLTDKLAKISSLADTRRLLIQEDFQYKPFLKAACHIILMDDEPVDRIDWDIYREKLRLCMQHQELEGFFLSVIRAFQTSTEHSFDISKMWAYYPAKHVQHTEKRVLKEIGSTIWSDGG